MRLNGHLIGLLKEYTQDLVEQARQEDQAEQRFGFKPKAYRPDDALSDLLALLDDRIESEGVQVGLPQDFLHEMWVLCNEAQSRIGDRVWLEFNLQPSMSSKATIRQLTYRALLEYLEERPEESA